ncbi:NACHT domain-containing protein [Cryptosporangium sp. NPDC051539]|uniref:NACHT domain-containing protein n=1 Tax=Cryptosporangium sp. NPDC051539 TaxID=3363962 RepID=UPI0037A89638
MLIVLSVVLSLVLGAAINLVTSSDVIPVSWSWTRNGPLIVVLLAALVILLVAVELSQDRTAPEARPADPNDPEWFAAVVRAAWESEERRRRLLHPEPIPTAWTTIGPPISDHWANLRTDGANEPVNADGVVDGDHPDALDDLLDDPRIRGRVVVLGEPGSGKTALLLRLARVGRIRPQGRVPVLLRLSSWDPAGQSFDDWVASRLLADYCVAAPVPVDRILPLLDGLDEMPAARRGDAVRAISARLPSTAPLVVTARTTEYLDALEAAGETVLPGAVVVELVRLPAAVVGDYLARAVPPVHADDWALLWKRDAGGHLTAAIGAPLWVDLMRVAYSDPAGSRDPADLSGLTDASAIHAHLLDALVPAAYPDAGTSGGNWTREDAQRWLTFLALAMCTRGTYDIAWWELVETLPRRARVMFGLVIGVLFGLGGTALAGWKFGVPTALIFGPLIALGLSVRTAPARRRVRFRRSGQSVPRRLFNAYGIGWVTGCGPGYAINPWLGIAVGAAIGFAYEFTTAMREDAVDVTIPGDPRGVERGDRDRAAVSGLLGCVLIGLPVGAIAGPVAGLLAGPGCGVVLAVSNSAWGRYLIARAWWAASGALPWRLPAFLADAHDRGVLRQVGGVYQFRHGLVRDRLAARWTTKQHDRSPVPP